MRAADGASVPSSACASAVAARAARTIFDPARSLPGAIQRLGFVQADPMRAPARAQDLILRLRVYPLLPTLGDGGVINGLRIGAPLTEFRGVLTGTPEYIGSRNPLLEDRNGGA